MAVDAKGVVYVADGGTNNEIFTETPSGSTYTQALLGGNQAQQLLVDGVAVDGADNVTYDYANNGALYYVVQCQPIIPVGCNGNIVADAGEGDGLAAPKGLAADSNGNIYIADTGNNRVVEVLYSSGSNYDQPSTWQINLATGLANPAAVAVDGSGNVYIADTSNNRVLRETPSGGGFFTQSVVSSGLSAPAGVAVDDVGNLYISDTGNQRVLKETVSSGPTYTQSVVLSSGLGSPQGLAVDASGNLYIADATNKVIVKLTMATPPSLTFASTAVGSTSSDSPQTVTLENIGTAALSFPIPGTGNNPAISANFSLNSSGSTACPLLSSSSSTAGTLAANATCTLPISFTPTANGSISGSLILTDNNLNTSGATQTISLSGNGASNPAVSLLPNPVAFGNQIVGTTSSPSKVVVLMNTGSGTLSNISVSVTGTNAGAFGETSACGTTLAGGASCNISVNFTPATLGANSANLSVADNATGSPQTVPLTGTGTAPQATLSSNPLAFPATLVGTAATALPMTLSNPGTAALTITGISVTGTNASSFGQSNNCGSSLAVGATCTITVTFTPGATGSLTAAISVADNATGSPQIGRSSPEPGPAASGAEPQSAGLPQHAGWHGGDHVAHDAVEPRHGCADHHRHFGDGDQRDQLWANQQLW